MTSTVFLERFLSVSVQAASIVCATYWIARTASLERTRCRLWMLCYVLLLAVAANAALLPHLRFIQPLRPLTRPIAAELALLQSRLGQVLLWAWLSGCGISLLLFIHRSIQASRFLRSCQSVDPDVISLAGLMTDDADGPQPMASDRTVRLISTPVATPPFCWQFHQPCIVIPESLLTFDRDGLRFILRHELAHLQTGHPLQVFLQRLIEILFWFHPMVWWASREWSLAREFQCDDASVQSRGDIVRYLKTLLTIAEQTASEQRPQATLSFVRDRCVMAERARRLVRIAQRSERTDDPAANEHRQRKYLGLQVIGLLAACLLWLPVNVLAAEQSHWSPWPTWTAEVLHDFGIAARDFETYDSRYAVHELYDGLVAAPDAD